MLSPQLFLKNGRQVLTPVVAIDTETYYDNDCSVKELGPDAYTRHPQFECYLISVYCPELDLSYVGSPKDFDWDSIDGMFWISHNTAFDFAVLKRLQETGVIPPHICPDQWDDTANLAAYLQFGRSLARVVATAYGKRMNKGVRDSAKGKRWHDYSPEARHEMLTYALDDVIWTRRFWEDYSPLWPLHERRISGMVLYGGARGIQIDVPALEESLKVWDTHHKTILNDIPWWGEENVPLNSPKRKALACREAGIEPPPSWADANVVYQKWEAEHLDKLPWLRSLKDLSKLNRVLKIAERIKERLRPDGVLGFGLKYHGAVHTGRLSGDTGINLQALNKQEINGRNLRQLFVPRKGYKFVIADCSQIEPRCLAYLTFDLQFLELVKQGVDIYEVTARRVFGYTDERPLKDVDKDLRQKAKAATLGLGYGLGAERFSEYAATYGLDLTPKECRATVALFREKNPLIVAYWHKLGRILETTQVGGTAEFCLPSGRIIRMFDVRRDRRGQATVRKEQGGAAVRTWGSKICENMVQAMARDVFMDCLLRITDSVAPPLFTVHDEVVLEVPSESAELYLSEMQTVLSTPPAWAPLLPLASEGMVSDYYCK